MRRRVVLAIVLVAAASVVLFALPLAIAVRQNYRDDELLRLQSDAVAATRQIDIGQGGGDPIEVPATADDLAVYSRAGRRLTGEGPARAGALVSDVIRTGRIEDGQEDGRLVAAVPLVTAERVTGAVRVARSDARVTSRVRRAWLALSGLAALVIALAAIAAVQIARRLARPVEQLARVARRLGEGDFTVTPARSGVTELDAVGEALDVTARRLDELLSRERAFSADASHQLRTPLAALRIELEAMALRPEPPPELGPALAQVDRLQETIDTLLAVARDAPRPRSPISVRALLEQVEVRWGERLDAVGRALRVASTGTDGLHATGSSTVLLEILSILVANAVEHGEGTVSVTARDAPSRWVAIDVEDEGPGVEGPVQAVFERRVGADAGGHGIGLALARSLAEAEGARLSLTRARPRPVFTLLIQQAQPPPASDAARLARAEVEPGPP